MNKILKEDSADNVNSDETEMSKKKKQDDLEYWRKQYNKMLDDFLKPEKRKKKGH